MKKWNILIILMVVVFAWTVIGCDTGDNPINPDTLQDPPDPVAVDFSMPSIQLVESFTGTFESDQDQALYLSGDTVAALGEIIEDLDGIPIISMMSRSGMASVFNNIQQNRSRNLYTDSDKILFNNELLYTGVRATGFIDYTYRMYMRNFMMPTSGDFVDFLARTKLGINVNDTTKDGITMNGKYTINERIGFTERFTSMYQSLVSFKIDINNNYVISASQGGRGIKMIVGIEIKVDADFNEADFEDDYLDDFNMFIDTFKLTVAIYDNNSSQPQFSRVFNSIEEAEQFFDY